jgi:hypothetical protein
MALGGIQVGMNKEEAPLAAHTMESRSRGRKGKGHIFQGERDESQGRSNWIKCPKDPNQTHINCLACNTTKECHQGS